MGKQAKPKPANQKGTQKKHNPLTRGINTKKPLLLWDWSILYDAIEEDLPGGQQVTRLHPKKEEELKNRLHPPYDDLLLDWETEMQHYAIQNQAKIERERLSSGATRYSVYKEYEGVGTQIIRKVILVVESPRSAVSYAKKSRKNKKKAKEEVAAPTPA